MKELKLLWNIMLKNIIKKENEMGIREEMLEMKKEVEEIQEESFAMKLLKDQKKQNKRQFIIILVILGMWFATIGYLVYVLNDIGTITEETTTQEITDFDAINGNIVNKGDINGENKTDSKNN